MGRSGVTPVLSFTGSGLGYTSTSPMLWFSIWFLVILKIPIAYLGYVIWWAVKDPPEPSVGPEYRSSPTEDGGGVGGAGRRRRPHKPIPGRRPGRTGSPRGGPHRSTRVSARRVVSYHETERAPIRFRRPSTSPGFLATIAIFAALVGIVYYPGRVASGAILVSLIAAAIGRVPEPSCRFRGRHHDALLVLGMLISIVFERPVFCS